jgi:CMP-N-acetylneuraminic acid synthetase
MRVVGLIPARGGSESIPRKNLAPLVGRPLLAWTIDAARAASSLEGFFVSTEDDEIASAALDHGADVLARPANLASDDTPMLDVVLHAAAALGDADVIALLQPTSPLRRAEHVDGAVRLLGDTGADGVVSVVRVAHRFSPESLMRLEGGRLVALDPDGVTRRQDKQPLFARNGPAVLVVTTEKLAERGLYGGDLRPYAMETRDSLDVDEPEDLELVEAILGSRVRG